MTPCHSSSKPDAWVLPRPSQDASQRLKTHGPVLPMERPKGELSLWAGAMLLAAVFAIITIWSVAL